MVRISDACADYVTLVPLWSIDLGLTVSTYPLKSKIYETTFAIVMLRLRYVETGIKQLEKTFPSIETINHHNYHKNTLIGGKFILSHNTTEQQKSLTYH